MSLPVTKNEMKMTIPMRDDPGVDSECSEHSDIGEDDAGRKRHSRHFEGEKEGKTSDLGQLPK